MVQIRKAIKNTLFLRFIFFMILGVFGQNSYNLVIQTKMRSIHFLVGFEL
jgi:hypothetical protein